MRTLHASSGNYGQVATAKSDGNGSHKPPTAPLAAGDVGPSTPLLEYYERFFQKGVTDLHKSHHQKWHASDSPALEL